MVPKERSRRCLKTGKKHVQVDRVTTEVLEEYFRKLYDAEDTPGCRRIPSATVTEMETRVGLKKNRKAPGSEDIPNKLLKYGGPELAARLTTLFNKILSTTEMWKD